MISPNHRKDLLPATEFIIAHAPVIPLWEFHPARPPKQWDFRFDMASHRGGEVAIDARKWKYLLTGYHGQAFFDITIVAPDMPRMDFAGRMHAAKIVIEGTLGERLMMEHIGRVEIVEDLSDPDNQSRQSRITNLYKHLMLLLRGT